MKLRYLILSCILLFLSTPSKAEVPYILEKEFKNSLKKNYPEKDFLRFYHVLDSLESLVDMTEFKSYKLYTSNIEKLANSFNVYQKGVAYRLIAILRDTEFCKLMQERLNTEENKFLKTWIAVALMRTSPKQTTAAFDYLVDNEAFADSKVMPFYLQMDVKSIIKTAYARLNDPRPKAKIFALQTLARFSQDAGVDSIIIKSLKDWDVSIKGYAIVALGIRRKDKLKAILSPYVKEPSLREVIISTLENSRTEEDVVFAEELKGKKRF